MKPSLPQGTRDFSPEVVRKRRYILDTLRGIFERYGFQPLETPAMENLSTLTGKYGEEGDRLIFKILNNGLHEQRGDKREATEADWAKLMERSGSFSSITERALRYDLTIPFARYVAMNHGALALPFRRYQMQPVWRADKPQRGRYREFWQCDCDVVGSASLLNEAELICIYGEAFSAFGLPGVRIKINSRKILAAMAEGAGHPDKIGDITIALDKLDKIGWSGVAAELAGRGISEEGVSFLATVARIKGSPETVMSGLEEALGERAGPGLTELRAALRYHAALVDEEWDSEIVVDPTLARGLDYYTGVIFEVTTDAVKMGSIGGGGRYDDLTSLFGVKGLTGVGVSFGIDRIYDVLDELALFPEEAATGTRAILLNFGGEAEAYALAFLRQLRAVGIPAELYPEAAKMDKQLRYIDKRGVPFAILAGENEMAAGEFALKELATGKQRSLNADQAISYLLGHFGEDRR